MLVSTVPIVLSFGINGSDIRFQPDFRVMFTLVTSGHAPVWLCAIVSLSDTRNQL